MRGVIQLDGATYYHERLWDALVQQNLEMGLQQNADRSRFNSLYADLDRAVGDASIVRQDLDFALQQLDDAVKRVEAFQRTQRNIND